jgi:hypothetical protein
MWDGDFTSKRGDIDDPGEMALRGNEANVTLNGAQKWMSNAS